MNPRPCNRHPQLVGTSLCIALLAGLVSTADAKRIYSYRDDSGVVHFSDRAPNDARTEVSEQLIEVDPKRLVYLREDGPDDDRRFSLWNGYGGPIEVLMDFGEAVNIVSEPPLPGVRVIPPQQHSLILQVQPIDDRRAWSYRLSYRYVHGDPSARHDPDAVYLLPFDERLSLRVDQAFGGKYSHSEEHSRHAVDLSMDEGTPVRAARAGVVMSVESDFHGAGTDIARYGDRANHIRVVHSDGTMAVYAHLELESVIVGIGDRVRAGEVIARSGNTGFSTGPHLHFVIQRNQGGALVSVPFQFTVNGERVTPEFGMRLGGQ
jgi:murein DD-endopeptidase MepM/ murein hydrolase activator NlpD